MLDKRQACRAAESVEATERRDPMISHRYGLPVCLVLAVWLLVYSPASAEPGYDRFERIVVVPGETDDEVQLRYVELLRDRILEQHKIILFFIYRQQIC